MFCKQTAILECEHCHLLVTWLSGFVFTVLPYISATDDDAVWKCMTCQTLYKICLWKHWHIAALTALRLTTLLRPHVHCLALAHVNTSDQLKHQPFCYHPRVARLSETGHFQWLPHGLGMPCHNTFGMHLLFPSFAENWRQFYFARRSRMRSVRRSFTADVYWLRQTVLNCFYCDICTVVLQHILQQCHLNNIHCYYYYY